jgi:hypothetical protein
MTDPPPSHTRQELPPTHPPDLSEPPHSVSDHPTPVSFQNLTPYSIFLRPLRMRIPICFHHDLHLRAIEVCDERSHRVLSPKLKPPKLPRAQTSPQLHLCRRRLAPHRASPRSKHRIQRHLRLISHVSSCAPSPCPLPKGEGGNTSQLLRDPLNHRTPIPRLALPKQPH